MWSKNKREEAPAQTSTASGAYCNCYYEYALFYTVSSPVTNLTCSGIDSNKLQVLWNAPIQKNSAEIRYEVYINDTIQLNAFNVGEDGSGNLIHNTRQNDVSYFTVSCSLIFIALPCSLLLYRSPWNAKNISSLMYE